MHQIIEYDSSLYNFRKLFENCIGNLEQVHKTFDTSQSVLVEKIFREVVHNENNDFKELWYNFAKNVIKKKYFENQYIIIQTLPSIKIFLSGKDWKYISNPSIINNNETNLHFEHEEPFYHPRWEINFIMPITNMDEFSGIFVGDKFFSPREGQILIFDDLIHGGYVRNNSKNTRVSIDFKAALFSKYEPESLSNDILCKKRNNYHKQKELFKIGNYYRKI